MLKKAILIFLIIVGLLYTGAEVAAANLAAKALAEAASKKDPLAKAVSASVSKPLLFNIVAKGQVDRIEISTSHVNVGPFLADKATAVLTGVRIDVGASIKQREPVIKSIDRLDMIVEFSSEEVSRILPKGFQFIFGIDGSVALEGNGAVVEGQLLFREPDTMTFQPDSGQLPGGVATASWRFEAIPFVTCIKTIEVDDSVLRLTCSQENPPATFPPK